MAALHNLYDSNDGHVLVLRTYFDFVPLLSITVSIQLDNFLA